jgi:hypothetical protein
MGYLGSQLVRQINAKGFRQWYEYELVRAFGFFALGVIALIVVMTSLEGILETRFSLVMLTNYLVSIGGICLGGWAWRRFINILGMADHMSRQAVCPSCESFGRLVVTDERSTQDRTERWISARCKKCDHTWRLFYPAT